MSQSILTPILILIHDGSTVQVFPAVSTDGRLVDPNSAEATYNVYDTAIAFSIEVNSMIEPDYQQDQNDPTWDPLTSACNLARKLRDQGDAYTGADILAFNEVDDYSFYRETTNSYDCLLEPTVNLNSHARSQLIGEGYEEKENDMEDLEDNFQSMMRAHGSIRDERVYVPDTMYFRKPKRTQTDRTDYTVNAPESDPSSPSSTHEDDHKSEIKQEEEED
ncbi:hypothetical protein M231_07984 [Tremella mesenterica]|uniref:Uncharacterized protein n=1 Tax=Tremella mesenterica TaxID=5217 RepID=A0A4Q1BFI8_TREME|nr:hypothetical protein M231_07984 [Tremella mesenterica]